MIHMEYYLVVSTIMMFAGIYGFFTRRNTLAILISVELMLNATDINFAVFNIADICAVLGALGLLLFVVADEIKEQKNKRSAKKNTAAGEIEKSTNEDK